MSETSCRTSATITVDASWRRGSTSRAARSLGRWRKYVLPVQPTITQWPDQLIVSDIGVGIAPEDQEKVFEEFRQVGAAAKKIEGTGLGLTLCRKFVELHGGKIWVRSQEGVGSTFTFTIPVRRGV